MRYEGHVPLHGPAYKTKPILIVTSEGRHNLCAAFHSYVIQLTTPCLSSTPTLTSINNH